MMSLCMTVTFGEVMDQYVMVGDMHDNVSLYDSDTWPNDRPVC